MVLSVVSVFLPPQYYFLQYYFEDAVGLIVLLLIIGLVVVAVIETIRGKRNMSIGQDFIVLNHVNGNGTTMMIKKEDIKGVYIRHDFFYTHFFVNIMFILSVFTKDGILHRFLVNGKDWESIMVVLKNYKFPFDEKLNERFLDDFKKSNRDFNILGIIMAIVLATIFIFKILPR